MISVDYNYIKKLLADHDKLVTEYNDAALTYSTAATAYKAKVTERKAQIASGSWTLETQIAIPPVPCLNFNEPAWAGKKFNSGKTTTEIANTTTLRDNIMFYSQTDA